MRRLARVYFRRGSARCWRCLGSVLAWAALLWFATAGCGAKASGGELLEEQALFLEACRQSCGSGLECIAGVCSQRCRPGEEDECVEFSGRARCHVNGPNSEGTPRCDVACGSDRGCYNALGPGYYCAAFCRWRGGERSSQAEE